MTGRTFLTVDLQLQAGPSLLSLGGVSVHKCCWRGIGRIVRKETDKPGYESLVKRFALDERFQKV